MKKILGAIFFFLVSFSGVNASVEQGVYEYSNGTLTITESTISFDGLSSLSKPLPLPLSNILQVVFSDAGNIGILIRGDNGVIYYSDPGTTNFPFTYQENCIMWNPGNGFFYGTTFCRPTNIGFLINTNAGPSSYFGPSSLEFDVLYNMTEVLTTGPDLLCTIEEIPDLDIINIHPQSIGDIAELIETPSSFTYGYSTSNAGDNPMQAIFLGIDDVSGFSDFSIQSGSLNFKTQNKTLLSQRKTFLSITSPTRIEYIKLLGDYAGVDVYTYNDNGVATLYAQDIDLDSYDTDKGYPVGGVQQVVIAFYNSIFEKTLEALEVYSIGANTTKEVEICYNVDNGEYTVDGETYTGNPYTNLVGTPTPTEVTFSQEGYLFYSNGFCLNEFIPFPSGGELFFDIKNPLNEIRTAGPVRETGLFKYGAGTCSKITTNFHSISGQYYVKGRYLYQGVSYDVHPNFIAYTISAPKFIPGIDEVNPWASDSICGVTGEESGFLPGVSRFFGCMSETISQFFANQYNAVKQIGGFIYDMTDIFTTEIGDLSFFATTYASEPFSSTMDFSKPDGYDESILGKINKLLTWGIALLGIVISIWVIIMIKQD